MKTIEKIERAKPKPKRVATAIKREQILSEFRKGKIDPRRFYTEWRNGKPTSER